LRSTAIRFALVACCLTCGDPTHDVSIHNAFNQAIDVYTFERKPEYRLHFDPGQTITQGWPYGWGPAQRRVEAVNAVGTLIFCEIVITANLEKRGWRIEVAPGRPSCD
jgi:hypothetical protein